MSEKREFKGVWIPKEIWLSDDLTLQEKVFLVEIDSLNNERGCFASNKYFAKFFKLTKQRVSQVIKSLEKKEYLSITYIYKGKEISERIIKTVSSKFDTYQDDLEEVSRKFNKGINFSLKGCQENVKDNNTSNSKDNNTNNNTLISIKPDLIIQELTQLLYYNIKQNSNPPKWQNNPPKLQNWYEDLEKLYRIDKIPIEQIEKVIIWATKNNFWKLNILSGKNLRKHFDRLSIQMKNKSSTKKFNGNSQEDINKYLRS